MVKIGSNDNCDNECGRAGSCDLLGHERPGAHQAAYCEPATGLLSGAVATLIYCLHCPEMEVAFWAVWYIAGMLIPTVIGALLAPRLLRW